MFSQNLFLVNNDDMNPYASRGDIVIYEPIQMGERIYKCVYVVEYKGKRMIVRIHTLIRGGMCLLFDSDRDKMIELKQSERVEVIFFGRVSKVLKRLE